MMQEKDETKSWIETHLNFQATNPMKKSIAWIFEKLKSFYRIKKIRQMKEKYQQIKFLVLTGNQFDDFKIKHSKY